MGNWVLGGKVPKDTQHVAEAGFEPDTLISSAVREAAAPQL